MLDSPQPMLSPMPPLFHRCLALLLLGGTSLAHAGVVMPPPPRYPTVHFEVGVKDQLFDGVSQHTLDGWIRMENTPLQRIGVPLPGATACVGATDRAPALPEHRVAAELWFGPARDAGKRVIVDEQQVWEARLHVAVLTGYEARDIGGCRRFWPVTTDRELRTRILQPYTRISPLILREVPEWGSIAASLQFVNEEALFNAGLEQEGYLGSP